jgi:hypothetical protein
MHCTVVIEEDHQVRLQRGRNKCGWLLISNDCPLATSITKGRKGVPLARALRSSIFMTVLSERRECPTFRMSATKSDKYTLYGRASPGARTLNLEIKSLLLYH